MHGVLLKLALVTSAAALLLAACYQGDTMHELQKDNTHESIFGRPQTDMDKRQSVEKFATEVQPAYEQFFQDIINQTGITLMKEDPSYYAPIADGIEIYRLPIITSDEPIPCDILITTGNKYFPPVGLTKVERDPREERCSIDWINPIHGGIISIGSMRATYAFGHSENRPVGNPARTFSDHKPSAWEESLPWTPDSPYNPQSK